VRSAVVSISQTHPLPKTVLAMRLRGFIADIGNPRRRAIALLTKG